TSRSHALGRPPSRFREWRQPTAWDVVRSDKVSFQLKISEIGGYLNRSYVGKSDVPPHAGNVDIVEQAIPANLCRLQFLLHHLGECVDFPQCGVDIWSYPQPGVLLVRHHRSQYVVFT